MKARRDGEVNQGFSAGAQSTPQETPSSDGFGVELCKLGKFLLLVDVPAGLS